MSGKCVVGPDEAVRSEVVYSGRVQGVGFRYSTRQVAQSHAVKGFVKNLPDGSVQLIAEGERIAVRNFVRDVERTMEGYIQRRQLLETGATGEFGRFEIRF